MILPLHDKTMQNSLSEILKKGLFFSFLELLSNFPSKSEENCCFSWFIEVHNTRKGKSEILLTYLRRNVTFEFGATFTRSAESLQRRRNQTQHPYGGISHGVKLNSRKK